jgi:sortase A
MPAISPSTKPEKLAINDLNIKLDIESGEIVNNKWPTSTTGLMHLASSPIPGEKGNAIIYGHNWKSILGELHLIKPGDQIKITNSNNEEITFNVTTTQVVEKTQSSVLNNSEDQRITLYTCTGFLDQKRLVVTALLAS